MACSLCKAVGDGNHRCFLRREHVAEVGREVLEEGLLRRADIPENCSQAQVAEQLISYVSNGLHICLLIYRQLFLRIWMNSDRRELRRFQNLIHPKNAVQGRECVTRNEEQGSFILAAQNQKLLPLSLFGGCWPQRHFCQ